MDAINWGYFVIMVTAMAVGFGLSRWTQSRLPLPPSQRWGIALGAFVGAMFGAKLPFLFEDWERFLDGFSWFSNGKTILTGMAGGYLGVEVAKWTMDIRVRTGDSFVVPAAAAIAVGRLGCFHAGCCFGKPTELPWGCVFPTIDMLPRHPTQVYEAGFHFLCVLVFLWCYQRGWFPGQLAKIYLITYALFRFATEWLRPELPIYAGLTGYQVASLVMAGLFSWLLWRDLKLGTTPELRQETA